MSARFLLRDLGVSLNELYGMMRSNHMQYREAKARFDAWEAGRLKILGNSYRNRWTIDGVEKQAAMRLPSLLVVDFLTCLKRPGQSDLDAVEEIMPRLQGITQKLGIKTLLLSQMSRLAKTDQAKGAVGGHSKGGGIVEELAHAEIELLKDAPESEGEQPKIIATVTKTRRGVNGSSFALDYKGARWNSRGARRGCSGTKTASPCFRSSTHCEADTMPKRRIPEEPRPPKTNEELKAERIELEREIQKVKKLLAEDMLFPTYRDRLERKINRLGGEILMIDRELDERSGQTTLF